MSWSTVWRTGCQSPLAVPIQWRWRRCQSHWPNFNGDPAASVSRSLEPMVGRPEDGSALELTVRLWQLLFRPTNISKLYGCSLDESGLLWLERLVLWQLFKMCASQVAEVEMPRFCQDAREVLQRALVRPPDTTALSAERKMCGLGPGLRPLFKRLSICKVCRPFQGITGQDVQRGTFAHRHCVAQNQKGGHGFRMALIYVVFLMMQMAGLRYQDSLKMIRCVL